MKKRHKRYLLLPLIILLLIIPCTGLGKSNSTREIIKSAMQDEMQRNISRLSLENMEQPFFISYTIFDFETVEIISTLGATVKSSENRRRNHNVRVMVGGYSLNDENFQGTGFRSRSSMIHGSAGLPVEDDYDGIRRSLWLVTDDIYKRAAEQFEHKKAALKQQTMKEEDRIDDFSRAPLVIYSEPPRTFDINRGEWEKIADDISGMFKKYPDIYSSQVRIFFYRGDFFLTNSEGSEVIYPLTFAALQVNAYTQAVDGEPLSNHVIYYCLVPDDLPPLGEIKQAVKTMAGELVTLRDAPVFDESYFGPVMLENQAAAEFFSQRLFSGRNGLIGYRKPVTGNTGGVGYSRDDVTLDDRIGRRILARDLSIKALPGLTKIPGLNLIGSYNIDTEGVMPEAELPLVENGILKTLLTNRTPTPKVRESNGHQRPVIGGGYWTSSTIGPGVISISTSEGKSRDELKEELLKRAGEEGLEYGILIKKLKPYVTGAQYYDPMVQMTSSYGRRDGTSLTEPILIYRVYIEDGREEPVRSAKLGSVSLSTLRHIVGSSEEQFYYNTLSTANWSSGVPATFIVPQTLILEELEVKNEKRDYTPKLPVVTTPLAEK